MTDVTPQTDSLNGVVVDNPGLKGNGAPTGNDVHDDNDLERVSDEDDEEDEDDYEEERQIAGDEDDEPEEGVDGDDEEDGELEDEGGEGEGETGGGGGTLTHLLLGDPNAEGEEEDEFYDEEEVAISQPVAPEPISRKRSQQEVVDDELEERDTKKVKA